MKRQKSNLGFTLVELLVVIGIIAVLIGILLPSLNKARRAAKTVSCLANLRSIGQAWQLYGSLYKGYFPGSMTSGAVCWNMNTYGNNPAVPTSGAYLPEIIQNWDWMTPVAKIWNVKLNFGPSVTDRSERFDVMRNMPQFICPDNDIIATGTSVAPVVPTGRSLSYFATTYFHLRAYDLAAISSGGVSGRTHSYPECDTADKGLNPQFGKIKNAASKIMVADGNRYSNPSQPPSIQITVRSSDGGFDADIGAFAPKSNGFNRSNAPGNTPTPAGTLEPRLFWARHGRQSPGGQNDTYLFNAVFFDGHAETLGDLTGSDPRYWVPSGTRIQWANTAVGLNKDTKNKFYPDLTDPVLVVP